MMLKNRRRTAAVALVAALVGAGAAFAYFSTAGSGDGAASVTTAAPLTIAPATPTGDLYPGGTGDVALSLANPNDFPLHVDALVLDTSLGTDGFAADAGHAACVNPDLTFVASAADAGWDVGANDALELDLAGAIAMGPEADDACQGATFTVYLKTGA